MDNIEIRKAYIEDADGIKNIIQYWIDVGNDGDKTSGYLRESSLFELEEIKELLKSNDVVVASTEDELCSFYFVNRFFHKVIMSQRQKVIDEKIEKGLLPKGKYAVSLLASTSEKYLGKGLNTKTLNLLRENLKLEFDYFIGVMSYDNIATHKSSLKMGWKHFGDIGIGILAVIGTTEDKNIELEKYINHSQI